MKNTINKKTLSLVLNQRIKNIAPKYYKNRLYYKLYNQEDVYNEKKRYINIHELMSLCKKWLVSVEWSLSVDVSQKGYAVTMLHLSGHESMSFGVCWSEDEYTFETEYEAIFEACNVIVESDDYHPSIEVEIEGIGKGVIK